MGVTTERLPTIAELLELPVIARGLPQVLAGRGRLDRRVRWVHVSEWASPATSLHGGELVLTTGIGFPPELERYVGELVDVGAAALVLELGRRYNQPPEDLVQACRERDLAFIVLRRGVKFVDVTQDVHGIIMGGQLTTLRESLRIHDAFTALTVRGADADEVVRTAATMAQRAVVLENLAHQALIVHAGDQSPEHVLNRWEQRSRATPSPESRTGASGPERWLLTSVEFRGRRSGRLAMLPGTTDQLEFRTEHVMVLERAALALTITRLAQTQAWEVQAHQSALREVIRERYHSVADVAARLTALGVPTVGRRFLVLLAAPEERTDWAAQAIEELTRALAGAGTPALVGKLGRDRFGVLLTVHPDHDARPVVERAAKIVRDRLPGVRVVGAGSAVASLEEVPRSFADAEQVVNAVPPGPVKHLFHTLDDIGLPELLYAMRDDLRLQTFAERRLGDVLGHDSEHGTDLLATLRSYLDAAGNKSIAARRGNLSRQALYNRLRLLEQILDCDLDDGARRAELQVAITALDAQRRQG